MKCDDIFEVILSGGHLAEEMTDHIDGCAECRALRDSVLQLDEAGERERARDLTGRTVAHVMYEAARITEERVGPPHTKMKEWWLVQRLAAAAAVILALGIGIMSLNRMLSGDSGGGPVVELAIVSEPEMDDLRETVTVDISEFAARYRDRSEAGHLDYELADLRSRITVASVGIEQELAGL